MGGICDSKKNSTKEIVECDTYHAKPIPESINEKLYNSIAKIKTDDGVIGTGFFMKIEINKNILKFLFTCHHIISENNIKSQGLISLVYGKKGQETKNALILSKEKRNIITFPNEDVTMIEIIEEDNIAADKYLSPNLSYIHGYDKYIDNYYYLAGYPNDYDERCSSSGKIIKLKEEILPDYKFVHTLHTKPGSSGSPLCNELCEVVGIHTSGNASRKINYGTFIGHILNKLSHYNFKTNIPMINNMNINNIPYHMDYEDDNTMNNFMPNNMNDIMGQNMNNNMNAFMDNHMWNNITNFNKNHIIIFHLKNAYYYKFFEFGKITFYCSENDLISKLCEKFTEKCKIKNINWIYTNILDGKVLNPMNTVKEQFNTSPMGNTNPNFNYIPDCINVDVSFPDRESSKIMNIYQKIKEVDDELYNDEIFTIHLRYRPHSEEKIYFCKKEKYSFILSIKIKLADLSYFADKFFSKLFGKNDKLYKLIEYCKQSCKQNFNYNFDESNKFYIKGKEINMNLTFEEAGLKNDSIIYVWKDSEFWNVSFHLSNGIKFWIQTKPYELISTLIEKCRNKINNYDKNITFLYNANNLDINETVAGFGLMDNSIITVII